MNDTIDSAQFINILLKVSRKLRNLFDARIRCQGLTLARALTLKALKYNNGFYQKNLAEELGIESATLVRIIDALEAQGLVARDISTGDRRARYITLTPKGREIVDVIESYAAELSDDVIYGIKSQDIGRAFCVLNQMAETIEVEGQV